ENCTKPLWDKRLQFSRNNSIFQQNVPLNLICPRGLKPPFPKVICAKELQQVISEKLVYEHAWWGKNKSAWTRIEGVIQCIAILKVGLGNFQISSTSIKLNWTCRFPGTCQDMRAMCRLAESSSRLCEAEEVKGEEILHGQEGTFTCSSLQPFTNYSVTISLPSSTVLFSWLFRTEETVPDKPEQLWLDRSSGSLRWKALPSCKGEIIGYQLNITVRSARDTGFLEMERLQVNGSITEHQLPEHDPGNSYMVSIQGLTAAGAGAASLWEFQTNSSDILHPLDFSCHSIHVISPSQGTAVLPLRPITSEGVREHQLVVATTHNGSVIKSTCLGQPQPSNNSQQPFNVSQQPSAYVAAVLNLTGPINFMLGNGTHGQGYHNTALQPGQDYMALLRLVRRSPQSEKFTCVCYSFSV
ncbi:PTPRU phosphatase, partial [Pitta sordida]|nr:PTPRU phosphatase [Pitta sordida]